MVSDRSDRDREAYVVAEAHHEVVVCLFGSRVDEWATISAVTETGGQGALLVWISGVLEACPGRLPSLCGKYGLVKTLCRLFLRSTELENVPFARPCLQEKKRFSKLLHLLTRGRSLLIFIILVIRLYHDNITNGAHYFSHGFIVLLKIVAYCITLNNKNLSL